MDFVAGLITGTGRDRVGFVLSQVMSPGRRSVDHTLHHLLLSFFFFAFPSLYVLEGV